MASALYTEVKSNGANSTFVRPQEGLFGLREWKTDDELCSLVSADDDALVMPAEESRRAARRRPQCRPVDAPCHRQSKRRRAGGPSAQTASGGDEFDGLRLLAEAVEIDCAEFKGEFTENGRQHGLQTPAGNEREKGDRRTVNMQFGQQAVSPRQCSDRHLETSAACEDRIGHREHSAVGVKAEEASCGGRLPDGDCQSSLQITSTDQTSSERAATMSTGGAREAPSASSIMPFEAIVDSITKMEKLLGQGHPLVGQGYLFLSRVLQLQGTLPAVLMAHGALSRVYQIMGDLIGTSNLQTWPSWQDFQYLFGRLGQQLEHRKQLEQTHTAAAGHDLTANVVNVKEEAVVEEMAQAPPQNVKENGDE
ncbi:unnamed protein product [Ostreobium quekettii]|uniref:Uncharacterized protein n=1 Tax=Ostreobium quekettii TaxID=121088 RepID=A0A8S1IY75_9CHLO|nr:unnamed protein product [Ostreobium quekettii]|eukprot:evm.model.scf_1780.2 EVM.evm.TU.scf_1780.2   scf_1780:11092-13602(-)